MKYSKPPESTQDHINKLISRGLLIHDREQASRYLDTISYYRLSAYFIPFEQATTAGQTRNHQFIANTSFDDVISLYVFDRQLRLMVLEAIERIEVAVRSKWANALSQSTSNAHAYMDLKNFKDPWKHQANLNKVAADLKESKEQFIQHYFAKYSEPFLPPIWAMVETLTMGGISHWLSNTEDIKITVGQNKKIALKKQIAHEFGLPSVEIFEKCLECTAYIRNICAHHSRLWNRHMVKKLPNIKKLNHELLTKTHNGQTELSNELYNYLVVICQMMKHIQPDSLWQQRLAAHIQTVTPSQQAAMGFPANWHQQPFWQ